MSHLEEYRKEDFERLSWQDYAENMEEIYHKIDEYLEEKNIEVDAIVPILRGGNFLGTYLAYKLGVLRINPVQYKYFFDEEGEIHLQKLQSIDTEKLPEDPVLLLTEDNHCFGTTAELAAKELKEQIPECTIIYAADHIDFSYKENKYADVLFYGRLTNETRELSKKEAEEKGINPYSHLLPWENLEEEWQTVQAKQYSYQDEEAAKRDSDTKQKFEN